MLNEKLQREIIEQNRIFTKGYREDDPYMEDFESDQQLQRPQPPLVKEPMAGMAARVPLPRSFDGLAVRNDLAGLFRDRYSCRDYGAGEMDLTQLSFLLWATQGIKELRGHSYATVRTVPGAGARHEFETYLLVRQVEGLRPGAYHYLPMEHQLEFLHPVPQLDQTVAETFCGQDWAAGANVIFYWAMNAYRMEWRYGIYAHRISLMNVGHVCQNLYLAATALGLGTCAVATFSHEESCRAFGLDGEDEYVVYAAPVGYPSVGE